FDIAEIDALVGDTVPDPEDRFDLAALDRPLRLVPRMDRAAFQQVVRAHVEADLTRRRDPARSQDMAVFLALLTSVVTLPTLAALARLSPRSRLTDMDDWWFGFFSFYASGPPPERLEQLLALSRAGVVEFLGADLVVTPDEQRGRFVATSSSVSGEVLADVLVEARLPRPALGRTADRLLGDLVVFGEATEHVLTDVDGHGHPTGRLAVTDDGLHLVHTDGTFHARRIAVGVHTSRPAAGAFARPRTNAPSFRQNDAVARHVLDLLADVAARRSTVLHGAV
ncbi:MAG: adenylate cyclase, partial [Acidimicrobiia bacterium]|nr:adenylate cyclase [Acidimicrobiia bacterium]